MGNIILAYFNTIERSLRSNNSFEKKKETINSKKNKKLKDTSPFIFQHRAF